MIRLLAIASLAIGLLSLLGEWLALDLPSVSWFFEMGPVFGWVSSLLLISGGIAAFLFLPAKVNWTPVTLQRFRRFRSIRRGWWSLLLLAALVFLALLDQALVGKRALVVKQKDACDLRGEDSSCNTKPIPTGEEET